MSLVHFGMGLAIAFLWGVNFVFIKIGLEDFPLYLFLSFRYLGAGLPIIFLWKKRPSEWKYIFAIAFTEVIMTTFCMYMAIELGLYVGLTSLLIQIQVVFTTILAMIFLKEVMTKDHLLGMLISLSGFAIIVYEVSGGAMQDQPIMAVITILSGGMFWAIANIFMKKAKITEPFNMTVWVSAISGVAFLGTSFVVDGQEAIVSSMENARLISWASLLFTVLLVTNLGKAWWMKLVGIYGASKVAPFGLMVPIFGLSSGAIFLGEMITPVVIIATILVLSGIYLIIKPKRQAAPKPAGVTVGAE